MTTPTKHALLGRLVDLLAEQAVADYQAELAEPIKPKAPKGGRAEWRRRGVWLLFWPRARGERVRRRSLFEANPPAKIGSE